MLFCFSHLWSFIFIDRLNINRTLHQSIFAPYGIFGALSYYAFQFFKKAEVHTIALITVNLSPVIPIVIN